ncbi:MAG: branched-chain amino acid ABC transporter permease [Hydrogenophaga sp.]|jgi:branched-chain amino acid transport system permease protein|nr:branched-chain amino acid ABC transporter permease [Hydrogenophaga sp.]
MAEKMVHLLRRHWLPALLFAALALLPLLALFLGQSYYITFATRVLVLAIAAVGLNIALGYGGMVSFGHALYVGLGAYVVAAMSEAGVQSGLAHLSVALAAGAVLALLLGLVCLRTSGIAFIMITLAFSQMFYYVVISLKRYGGDDGMALPSRSTFFGASLEQPVAFYYVVFVLLTLAVLFVALMARSRFGWVVRGAKLNARRMAALGYPVLRYRLAAYVLSALICVLAGVLLANLARFASPSYLQWSLSGELIVMVVLGGMGTVLGPVFGAIALLVLEELLANAHVPLPFGADAMVRSHFMGLIGIFIVLMGMGTRHGLAGLANRKAAK